MPPIQVHKLLFDRLVDLEPAEPHEARPLRTEDREGLLESIRRELERLFGSTSPLPPARLAGRERTVIDYGIPDPLSFSAANADHRESFARLLEKTVAAYEPRLENPRIEIAAASEPGSIAIGLTATLRQDEVKMPIHFPIVLREKEATVSVVPGAAARGRGGA